MSLRIRIIFLTLMVSVNRSSIGAHCTFSIYIYKMGLHFSMTAID